MSKYFLLLTLIVFDVGACTNFKVPVKIENPYNNTPFENRESERLIIVPIEYEGWKLMNAFYYKNKNVIGLGTTESKKYPGMAIYYFLGTLDLYSDSYVEVGYTPLPEKEKDGSMSFKACLHIQKIEWEI